MGFLLISWCWWELSNSRRAAMMGAHICRGGLLAALCRLQHFTCKQRSLCDTGDQSASEIFRRPFRRLSFDSEFTLTPVRSAIAAAQRRF
jgi:hypothetical protein